MSNDKKYDLYFVKDLLKMVSECDTITFDGIGSKPCNKIANIVITSRGAGTEFISHNDNVYATNIPALNVYEWNANNSKYLKEWLISVLNDSDIKSCVQINITTTAGPWKKKILP